MSTQYRPYLGEPFEPVLQRIAAELNKTSLNRFTDMTAGRHCIYEMWRRMFPDEPFPVDADALRTKYYKDPEIVQSA